MRFLVALAALAMLAAPDRARADRAVDKLLADNPPLALLVQRVDKLQLELSGCDWFGSNDVAECKRRMDAHEITRIVERVRKPTDSHQKVYCTSYNRPLVADRSFRPVSGFKCWISYEYATETLELSCDEAMRTCSLHDRSSNDDEDTDYRFDFQLTGRGRALAIADDTVKFSFAHTN